MVGQQQLRNAMKTALILCTFGMSVTLLACDSANASGLDGSNPLHCTSQLHIYSELAREQGLERQSRVYGVVARWYAIRARALPAEQLTPDAIGALIDRILAAPDGGFALARECGKHALENPEVQNLFKQR